MNIVFLDLSDLFGDSKRPKVDESLNPIYEQLHEVGDRKNWPMVFDRFDTDMLQRFHDECLEQSKWLAEQGQIGPSIGALETHNEVCKYLSVRMKLPKIDKAQKEMQSRARHN